MKIVSIFLSLLTLGLSAHLPKSYVRENYLKNEVVKNFIEYVQIDTSQPSNLEPAVDFWKRKAKEVGLQFQVLRPAGLPIVVLTWPGSNCSLPSIMLNSHMDVVPAESEEWTYPPFSAHMDENGDIYGRGTQDDKDVAVIYLEAIRKLKNAGVSLKRTLHMTFMPDEETGGRGMEAFVQTEDFKKLNIGFALDEAGVSIDDSLHTTYLDKRPWQMNITVYGTGGHGSSVAGDTAADKLRRLIDVLSNYREEQRALAQQGDPLDAGAYDSLNINIVSGGRATNVVPSKMSLVVDMRLATSANLTEVEQRVNSWLQTASMEPNETSIRYIRKMMEAKPTKFDDSNLYWVTFKNTINELGYQLTPVVSPAVSDMVPVRNIGVPALGFAFKTYTIGRFHAANEYLNVANLIRGVEVYVQILTKLGNLGDVVYVP